MQINTEFPVGCAASWRTEPANHTLLASWLHDPGSLTAKLKGVSERFRVHVLGQESLLPESHELDFLAMDTSETCVVREVLLLCDELPWVFARSVLPLRSLNSAHQALTSLGENPLGEKLFNDSKITPGPIQIAEFSSQSPVTKLDRQLHAQPSATLWGRRRRFELALGPILVAEVFLSPAPCYADN